LATVTTMITDSVINKNITKKWRHANISRWAKKLCTYIYRQTKDST